MSATEEFSPDDCRCIANIWKGGEGGRCSRKNIDNVPWVSISNDEEEYCKYHSEKYLEVGDGEGGQLDDEGKAAGLFMGNILDGKGWEDMVRWESLLSKSKKQRMMAKKFGAKIQANDDDVGV